MKEEEKRLLTIDLCTRLPYCPKAKCIRLTHVGNINNASIPLKELQSIEITGYEVSCNIVTFETEYGFGSTEIQDIRPYLRTMSSMTEEEKEVLCELCEFFEPYNDRDDFSHYGIEIIEEFCVNDEKIPLREINYKVIDWLNSHYFDYRNLIEKGLALEAPEGMYK